MPRWLLFVLSIVTGLLLGVFFTNIVAAQMIWGIFEWWLFLIGLLGMLFLVIALLVLRVEQREREEDQADQVDSLEKERVRLISELDRLNVELERLRYEKGCFEEQQKEKAE